MIVQLSELWNRVVQSGSEESIYSIKLTVWQKGFLNSFFSDFPQHDLSAMSCIALSFCFILFSPLSVPALPLAGSAQ